MRIVNYLFVLLLTTFVLEFSLGVSVSTIPGFSLKNIVIYILIMAMLLSNSGKNRPIITKNKLNIPIFLFIMYCLVSLIATSMLHTVPSYSITSELILFKSYMDPYLLFIITVSLFHDEKSIFNSLLVMLIVMAVFVSITVLSSFDILSVSRVVVDDKWGRTKGAFSESNQFAAYLVVFIPLLGAFLITSKNRLIKLLFFGVLLVTLYVFLLTGSRGGILSLIVAVGVYYVLYSRYSLLRTFGNLIGIYITSSIIVMMVFFVLPKQTADGLMAKITGKTAGGAELEYSSGRLDIWGEAFDKFFESPLIGTGWNTFVSLFGINSHNEYIAFLVTTGVVGLFLFCRIFYLLLKTAYGYRKKNRKHMHYFNAYISGLSAFMVALLFVNIYSPMYFVMIYSALIIRLGMILPKEMPAVGQKEFMIRQNSYAANPSVPKKKSGVIRT